MKIDYLIELNKLVKKHPEAMIGGQVINALKDNPYSTASQLLVDYLYEHFNKKNKNAFFFTSNNLVAPSKIFNANNGFNASFPLAAGEDRELCDRWHHQGRELIYEPKLIIYHSHTMNLFSFFKQHFNYGRGSFHYQKIRNSEKQGVATPEPFSFYLKLLFYPLTKKNGWQKVPVLLLFLFSQIATVAGSLYTKTALGNNTTRRKI